MARNFYVNKITATAIHSGKYFPNFFHIEMNTIIMTIFHLIINQTEFCLVANQMENRHYDRITINLKGSRKRFL